VKHDELTAHPAGRGRAVARPDHVGGPAGKRKSDGGKEGRTEILHGVKAARDAAPCLGAGPGPEATAPPILALAIRVAWSVALFVKTASESRAERLRASFRFARRSCRLCASGFATSRRRGCGQLPDALRQDRPAPPAQGVEFGFGPSPSVVGVDGAARLAQQLLHQLRRAESAGFDGESQLPEKISGC